MKTAITYLLTILCTSLIGCSHTRLEYGGAVYSSWRPIWSKQQIKRIEVGYTTNGLPVFIMDGYIRDDEKGFQTVPVILRQVSEGTTTGLNPL